MSEENLILRGFWHKVRMRCDRCNRFRDRILVVKDGPTTGNFCSPFCYQAAREEMDSGNVNQL